MDIMSKEMENFSREMETMKNNQIEIIKLRVTVFVMKNSLDGVDDYRIRVVKHEDRSIEIIHCEEQRVK